MPLRFHTQTAGSTLTAQQPEVNVVRTAMQALSAVLGGTQSLHTNSMDEALGLPTEQAALLALRTQQVLAHETGVADTIDPLAGSYYVESLTDDIEAASPRVHLEDRRSRRRRAGDRDWASSSGRSTTRPTPGRNRVESGDAVVVGVNRFIRGGGTDEAAGAAGRRVALQRNGAERLAALRDSARHRSGARHAP